MPSPVTFGSPLPVANGGTGTGVLYKFGAQGNNGANQAIPSGAFTKVTTLGSELFDTGSWFASNQGTVPVTGTYLVIGGVTYNNPTATTRMVVEVWVNDTSAIVRLADNPAGTTVSVRIGGASIVSLTAGQTIQLYTWHNKGSDADVENNNGSSFFATLLP